MPRPEPGEGLGIVLLAAGGSARLGQPKQLIPVGGEALVLRTARRLLCLEPAKLIVVTGCVSAAVAEELAGLPLQIVHNPGWQEGMGTSIALGVKHLPKKVSGVLIMLCDQWCVGQEDLKRLFEVWITDISAIVAVSWISNNTSVFGPPTIFPRILFHELMCLTGDQGAKRLIEEYRSNSTFISMENASPDLDEPGDLQNLE
jgi:molybdenum cofactor cytidylyltransferase